MMAEAAHQDLWGSISCSRILRYAAGEPTIRTSNLPINALPPELQPTFVPHWNYFALMRSKRSYYRKTQICGWVKFRWLMNSYSCVRRGPEAIRPTPRIPFSITVTKQQKKQKTKRMYQSHSFMFYLLEETIKLKPPKQQIEHQLL